MKSQKQQKHLERLAKFNVKIKIDKKCLICNKKFLVVPSKKMAKYCSRACKHLAPRKKGADHPSFKGGGVKSDGYRYICNKPEHRIVMEKELGRKLKGYECVHHKNGIKDDNRLENLELMSKSKHASLHGKISTWARRYNHCRFCGTNKERHHSRGFCWECRGFLYKKGLFNLMKNVIIFKPA